MDSGELEVVKAYEIDISSGSIFLQWRQVLTRCVLSSMATFQLAWCANQSGLRSQYLGTTKAAIEGCWEDGVLFVVESFNVSWTARNTESVFSGVFLTSEIGLGQVKREFKEKTKLGDMLAMFAIVFPCDVEVHTPWWPSIKKLCWQAMCSSAIPWPVGHRRYALRWIGSASPPHLGSIWRGVGVPAPLNGATHSCTTTLRICLDFKVAVLHSDRSFVFIFPRRKFHATQSSSFWARRVPSWHNCIVLSKYVVVYCSAF